MEKNQGIQFIIKQNRIRFLSIFFFSGFPFFFFSLSFLVSSFFSCSCFLFPYLFLTIFKVILGGLPGYLYFAVYSILCLAFVERYQLFNLGKKRKIKRKKKKKQTKKETTRNNNIRKGKKKSKERTKKLTFLLLVRFLPSLLLPVCWAFFVWFPSIFSFFPLFMIHFLFQSICGKRSK